MLPNLIINNNCIYYETRGRNIRCGWRSEQRGSDGGAGEEHRGEEQSAVSMGLKHRLMRADTHTHTQRNVAAGCTLQTFKKNLCPEKNHITIILICFSMKVRIMLQK